MTPLGPTSALVFAQQAGVGVVSSSVVSSSNFVLPPAAVVGPNSAIDNSNAHGPSGPSVVGLVVVGVVIVALGALVWRLA